MLFHSLQFLLFLPLALLVYWFCAEYRTIRNVVLVCASLVFYMAWNPLPAVLLLYLTSIDWLVGRMFFYVDQAPSLDSRRGLRRLILVVSIANNVGALALFKYADWLMLSVVGFAEKFGVKLVYQSLGLVLPVGLSFIVFQGMSYTIDVYRKTLTPRQSWLDVAVFMTFFPHVVAGPIVRASDFLPQIDAPKQLADDVAGHALFRIATGMVKKLVIADFLSANLINRVFADEANYTGGEIVFAVFAYTLQIYYDFSAYSDIAIGTAALFGFVLKENFDKPYMSVNLFEFWRRWHMSLGSWLRDYVYIPLGGNRDATLFSMALGVLVALLVPPVLVPTSAGLVLGIVLAIVVAVTFRFSMRARALHNLALTQIVGGVWHGADWRFVVWGVIHGVLLSLNRLWWWYRPRNKTPAWWSTAIATLLTFVVVVECRIIFRARDIAHAGTMFLAQFKATPATPNLTWQLWLVLGVAVCGHVFPNGGYQRLSRHFVALPPLVRGLCLLALLLIIKNVANFEAQPFIYFKF